MQLIGRNEEIDLLENMYESNRPEFLAIYGRRRVGKTYLIRLFAETKKAVFFNITGIKDAPRSRQLETFAQQLSKVFYSGVPIVTPKNWGSAFQLLTDAANTHSKKKRIILFFDELPWLATPKSMLLQELDYYWNQHWSNDARIKLIVCGSNASWIIHKIINNKGGLHNRITQKIALEPFTLSETNEFLINQKITLKKQQLLMVYMVTGGIPYYLSYIEKGLSAAQIIEKIAFTKKSFLFSEFENLFSSLFDNAENYIKAIKIIASRRYGIGQQELLIMMGKSVMGSVGVNLLRNLEETGFIISFVPHEHKRQGIYYRLIDEYVYFYLKWIEPIKSTLQKNSMPAGYWLSKQQTSEWSIWLGYSFESFCLKHISLIRQALSIPPDAVAHSWRYVPRKNSDNRGAQIDLLFDRNDDAITICEIKYTEEPFTITKEYLDNLQKKMTVYKEQTGTKKQLFLAIISANGIKNNYYAEQIVSGIVTLEDFFK